MTIRPLTAADLSAVEAIQQASPTAAQWPVRDYLVYESSVCEVAGEVAGFLVVREVAPSEREILNLAVAPAFRRLGVATLLLRNQLSGRSGDWYLEVRSSNEAARIFYKLMGFHDAGIRPSYYSEPAEDCIVMKFQS